MALSLLLSHVGTATPAIVSRVETHSKVVALTFDAGADRGYASKILRTLEQYRIHATFGMTGRWAKANADLVRRIARDGDAFMNHTYDHQSFTGFSTQTAPLTESQRMFEITSTDKILRTQTGHDLRPYFRPPYGDYDAATLSLLHRLGYRFMVMWTVDSLGWERISAGAILQRCLSRVAPGTIYLMHVGIQSQDAFALALLVRELGRKGYRFATIPQLLRSR